MSGDNVGDIKSGGRGKGSDILKASSDTEFLHSFLRVGDIEEPRDDGGDVDKRKKKWSEKSQHSGEKERAASATSGQGKSEKKKGKEDRPKTPTTPPPAGPTSFNQISREIKMKQKQSVKHIRGKRVKVRRQEECYTDKDRAAAVNLGSRDIKQSLKIKRRQDRSRTLMIPEEAEPSTLLALGSHELRTGDVEIAITFVNKAGSLVKLTQETQVNDCFNM